MLLDAFREVYYQGGVSSVYLWDLEEATADAGATVGGAAAGGGSPAGSFAGCFLILKRVGGERGEGPVGSWESSHVVQVREGYCAVLSRYLWRTYNGSLAINPALWLATWVYEKVSWKNCKGVRLSRVSIELSLRH